MDRIKLTALISMLLTAGSLLAQPPSESELFSTPESTLGPTLGASSSSGFEPGGGTSGLMGGRLGSSIGRTPYSISQPADWSRLHTAASEIVPSTPQAIGGLPQFGPLTLPAGAVDDGPPHGLTLDQAIEMLVRENLDLRSKSLELPQADADILTAGLRANPLLFGDGQLVPYGQYDSVTNPGGPAQYDANISLPFDVTRKRVARQRVAVQAKRVLEAQYQDAVRQGISNLYTAYVDVLSARETVRFATASVNGLNKLVDATKAQHQQTLKSQMDVNQTTIQRDAAALGLMEAEAALYNARLSLAVLLNIPSEYAANLELRGTVHDIAPPPPTANELIPIALRMRPDLAAYQLAIQRAQADERLARANWMQDVYVVYQPFTYQDNVPYRAPSSRSWGLGATAAVPIFDRNQGNIRRAQINVDQTRLEYATLERTVIAEVQQAHLEYQTTRAAIERIERDLLPAARQVLDTNLKLYQEGQEDIFVWLGAQREYNDLVRQYRDTLVAHRRSMLKLNTAVGQRLLP
jgi:cobalt-zinc-cadmium efflux system outer membrane protein